MVIFVLKISLSSCATSISFIGSIVEYPTMGSLVVAGLQELRTLLESSHVAYQI